jgi:alpha-tubulin suppressor-like RCC1 family protein
MRRAALWGIVVLAVVAGCKRNKPPIATRVWLGPSGGCVETPAHPTSGTFACWGVNDAGQLGDGTTEARAFATRARFDAGKVTELALGEKHACGVFDRRVQCWGEGAHGQLGSAVARSLLPIAVTEGDAVAVGGAHTCVRGGIGDQLRCFGADDDGQLGGGEWPRGARVRSFALGTAHTCVAYERSSSTKESVVCRGRAVAAPRDPLLGAVVVKELAAGGDHTCALIEDGTVRCWGKNDAGQLGDGTTSDASAPVSVAELRGVIQVVAGLRHTCALLQVGTVACWGANESHQLSIGTTENSTVPRVVVGLVGGKEIAAAGDGTCARLEGGYVRCWGKNDRAQLGGGSTVEHTVPVQIQFR